MNVERELMKAAVPTPIETDNERIDRAIDEPMLRLRVLNARIAALEQQALDCISDVEELPSDEQQYEMRWRFHVLDSQILRDKDPMLDDLRDEVAVRLRTPEALLAYAMTEKS
jgi:hypothetical protein